MYAKQNNASAIASVTVPDEASRKIDYLNERATEVYRKIYRTFRDMFNLNGPSSPRYYKELIDAIKNDEYTIDEKYAAEVDEAWEDYQKKGRSWFDYSVFAGLKFTKFPAPDYDGADKARDELEEEMKRVKDIIAIKSADEALEAIQGFEKWQPSNAPTKQ